MATTDHDGVRPGTGPTTAVNVERRGSGEPGRPESPTAFESETDTTTTTLTERPYSFTDDFAAEDLGGYRAVSGSLDPWALESKVDGASALVDTTGSGERSLIAPTTDALTWTGTGRIATEITFGADDPFQNATLVVGEVASGPRTDVQIQPDQLLLSTPTGDTRQRFPAIGVEEPLPASTVAFGIEAGRGSGGGKTWFDAVDAQPHVVHVGRFADVAHLGGAVGFRFQFVGIDDVIAHCL